VRVLLLALKRNADSVEQSLRGAEQPGRPLRLSVGERQLRAALEAVGDELPVAERPGDLEALSQQLASPAPLAECQHRAGEVVEGEPVTVPVSELALERQRLLAVAGRGFEVAAHAGDRAEVAGRGRQPDAVPLLA